MNISESDFKRMLKFGNPSNKIGIFESTPFIELPFGLIKKDLPALQKKGDIIAVVNLVMQFQYTNFDAENESGNDIISFLLWIRDQQEFINHIEQTNLHREPKAEMLAAGIHRLDEFGVYATIDNLAGGDLLKHSEIESMPYFKIYEKLKLNKVQQEIEESYQKIIEKKRK